MRALDITPAQATRIAKAAAEWATTGHLPIYERMRVEAVDGETFGEWLAGYLDSLAPEPAAPNLGQLARAMSRASEEYDKACRASFATHDPCVEALTHAKLIQARAAYIGARAMADAKNPHKDTTP